jgi:hypothetical protein
MSSPFDGTPASFLYQMEDFKSGCSVLTHSINNDRSSQSSRLCILSDSAEILSVMVTPDTLCLWLKEQAVPVGIILLLVGAAFLILKVSAIRRRAILSRERSGINEQVFVRHLARYNFDPVITGSTYRYFQEVQRVQFPILPSDALDEDLGLDSDDLDQTLRDLLRSLRREEVPGLRYDPILTVEDLVRHLQASPRKNQRAAA